MVVHFTIEERKLDDIKIVEKFREVFCNLGEADFEELKKDIAERGIMVEPHINKDGTLICGHQRIRALKEIGEEDTVNCKVFDFKDELDAMEHAIRDNVDRRQLTTPEQVQYALKLAEIEKERARRRMLSGKKREDDPVFGRIQGGRTDVIVAKKMKIGASTITRGKRVLTKGSEKLKQAYKQNKIATETAYKISKEDEATQEQLVEEMEKGVTLKQAKKNIMSEKPYLGERVGHVETAKLDGSYEDAVEMLEKEIAERSGHANLQLHAVAQQITFFLVPTKNADAKNFAKSLRKNKDKFKYIKIIQLKTR